jgi:hypothetical protein
MYSTNDVRLCRAYVNLSWSKINLLPGGNWHFTACFPCMITLNTGASFRAFNRNDRIGIDLKPELWLLSVIAVCQIVFFGFDDRKMYFCKKNI